MIDVNEIPHPVAQLEHEQMLEGFLACIRENGRILGNYRHAQRRCEISYTAVENEFLVFNRWICGRERTVSQIVRVCLSRGEIMTAGAVERQRAREVRVLLLRQNLNVRPMHTAVLNALVSE